MGIYKTSLEWIEKNAKFYDIDDILTILNKYEKNFDTDSDEVLRQIRYILLVSKSGTVTRAAAGIFCKYARVEKINSDVKNEKGEYVWYSLRLPISDELKHAINRKAEEYKQKMYLFGNFDTEKKPHFVDLDLEKFEMNKKEYNKEDILTIIYKNRSFCSDTVKMLKYFLLRSHNRKVETLALNCFKNFAYVKKINTDKNNGDDNQCYYAIDVDLPQELKNYVTNTYFDLKCEDEFFKLADCNFIKDLRWWRKYD